MLMMTMMMMNEFRPTLTWRLVLGLQGHVTVIVLYIGLLRLDIKAN